MSCHRVIAASLRFKDGRIYDVLASRVEAVGVARRAGAGATANGDLAGPCCVLEVLERRLQSHMEFHVSTPPELADAAGPVLLQRARRRIEEYLTIYRHAVPLSRAERVIRIEMQ